MKPRGVIAAILPAAVSAKAAMAGSYTGNWPLTVTRSRHGNGTYCLTFTDDGVLGCPHSGGALLSGQPTGGNLPDGAFQLIDRLIVATIEQPREGRLLMFSWSTKRVAAAA